MAITTNSLLRVLLISVSLRSFSEKFPYCLLWNKLFSLLILFLFISLFILGGMVSRLGLERMVLWRSCCLGSRSTTSLGHQNQALYGLHNYAGSDRATAAVQGDQGLLTSLTHPSCAQDGWGPGHSSVPVVPCLLHGEDGFLVRAWPCCSSDNVQGEWNMGCFPQSGYMTGWADQALRVLAGERAPKMAPMFHHQEVSVSGKNGMHQHLQPWIISSHVPASLAVTLKLVSRSP